METDKVPSSKVIDIGDVPRTPSSPLAVQMFKWFLRLRLFRRATVWWPTLIGWCFITALAVTLGVAWFNYGESFLALTHRAPADVLVVEGWISRQGIRAAVDEFEHGGYHYIVASGGLTSGRWGEDEPASYAMMAGRELMRLGIPKEKLIVATSENTEAHRTFESAVAVWRILRSASIRPKALNVFTLGPHARRSALVFEKVESPGTQVGVIGWIPPEYKFEPWWRSSERSRELLEETVGYFYELLFNSGRRSNAPTEMTPVIRWSSY
jgi:DUF218 domain